MQKIYATKGSSDDGINAASSSRKIDLSITTDVGENVTLSNLNEGKFAVVTVREEVCERSQQVFYYQSCRFSPDLPSSGDQFQEVGAIRACHVCFRCPCNVGPAQYIGRKAA